MDLRIKSRDVGDVRVVEVDGVADLASVPQLQTHLRREVTAAAGRTIVVDLDGLLGLDDVALGILLGAAATAREQGGDLEVTTVSPRWRERLRATKFDLAVAVRDSVV
jgi:anti-anti-sigma factor